MSFLESLRSVRQTKQVTKHSFLTKMSKGIKSVHIFIEGKTDIGFYGSILHREAKGYKINTHICGNKDRVYETKLDISDKENIDNRILFFVDKDLDDIIPVHRDNCDKTHITQTYSIENYFSNSEVLHRYFCDVFKVEYQSDEMDIIIKKFIENEKIFCHAATTIMAWIILARRAGHLLDLSKIKMGDLYDMNDELDFIIKTNNDDLIQYLTDKTKTPFTPSIEAIQQASDELKQLDKSSYIRGKFHSWFFVKFAENVRKCLETIIGKKVKQTTSLTESNLIEILSPRIETPETIRTFIESRLFTN